ncbi:MAG: SpoIIE family protein phosphatase [Bacteroidales bacterium]|nr:SpoIIE family protein phosphatase [Bacteroidales bacterium]
MSRLILIVTFLLISVVSFSQDSTEVDSLRYKEAEDFVNKAIDFSMEDEFDSTVSYLYKALEIYEKLENNNRIVLMLTNIGIMYSNYDQLQQGFFHYEKALKIANEIRDTSNLAWLNHLLGLSNMNLNAFDLAAGYLEKSKELYTLLQDTAEYKLLEAIIAKNNFDMAKQKGLNEMIKANVNQEKTLKNVEVQDFMVIDYLSLCFSSVYDFYYVFSRLSPNDTLKNYYKKTMQEIYDESLKYEEYMELYSSRQKISNAYIFLAKGNLKQAGKLLKQVEERNTPEFYGAMEEYCKVSGDYENALKYGELRNKCEKTVFSSEFAVKYERNLTQQAYEEKISAKENNLRKLKINYKEQQQRAEVRKNFFTAFLVFIALIIGIMTVMGIHQIRVSNDMSRSNEEILKFNNDLKLKNQDILAQKIALSNLKEQIEVNSYDLKRLNTYLSNSILMAQDIQKAIIPDLKSMNAFFGECFVYLEPKNIVSGDFYWIAERSDKKYLITADCTGHGVPGALLSILGISILSDLAPNFPNHNAGEILDGFKNRFVKALRQGSGDLDESIDLSLLIFDKNKTTLQYAGAKRPLYVVRDHVLQKYMPDLLSIGRNIGRENLKFTNHEIEIQKGDMIYTFSDGITDQMGGETGFEKFSQPTLRTLLTEIAEMTCAQQYRIIAAAIKNHKALSTQFIVNQTDDQLMIGIKR